jgi:hypothetical protein
MNNEEWRPIPAYEAAYEISSFGRIRCLRNSQRARSGHIKKLYVDPKSYLRVTLCQDAKPKTVLVHRLVAQVFLPNPLNKPQINHHDGDKQNNRVTNLEWVTNLENRKHAIKHGLHDSWGWKKRHGKRAPGKWQKQN